MLSLVYVSHATREFGPADLDALLAQSRRNNLRAGITGMLIYRDGDFLQFLEGPEDAVRATWWRIARDPRHGGAMVLDESKVEERSFGNWSMGFRRLCDQARPEGFVDFFDRRRGLAELVAAGPEAMQYLRSFRELG
ncbi:MAG: hypothetical protein K0S16_136 [Moraxellaceae bacterium]|jgi:hypothetical protein|nr:hypothetical protein [Moraxellaceae bacterium]